MNPSVAIIILNWNNPDDTLACLDSVAAPDYPTDSLEVIVVDNGSTDDSVARIRAKFPAVTIIETGANLGYAGGNNAGIRHALAAGAEAVCILNNDVTVEPDFLAPLIAALHSQPDVGIVTPLVAERTGDGGRVWALGSAVNRRTAAVNRYCAGEPVDAWRGREPFAVEIASGAAMLIRREVFERVGLMDEDFFLYFEEVDWCLKVRQAGYRILAVPASLVWHNVSATLGTTSPVIDYYMLRNHLRLISRHWRGPRRIFLQARVVVRNLLTIAAYTAKPHGGQRIPNRDARLLALRDAALGRWGEMGPDVARICYPNQ
ncbi:MAG: glycosyltransferase family 2 protein [Anaerolineae bacterium]